MQFAVYYELALALFPQESYEDVADNLVAAVAQLREGVPVKSALHGARRRWGEDAMRAVFERVAGAVAGERTRGAYWSGYRTLAVDAFLLEVPDSPANRAEFGGPSARIAKGCFAAAGYPQVRVVTIAETGTRAPLAAAIGSYRTAELTLAAQLADAAGEGDLVLFDRAFPCVTLWQAFEARGAAIVMRASKTVARTAVQPLPDGTYLARMTTRGRHGRPGAPAVTMRVVEYRIDGGETIRLLTNLVDTERYSAAALAALYAERWQTEVGNLQLKVLQRKPDAILRSHTPTLVRQEIWAHLTLNHTLTRLTTLIADERGQDPERVSFTKVLKEVRRSVIRQLARRVATALTHALDIADDLRRYHNPPRTPRTSDRTVKRLRHRYPYRALTRRTTQVTYTTPPKTITLLPIPHN